MKKQFYILNLFLAILLITNQNLALAQRAEESNDNSSESAPSSRERNNRKMERTVKYKKPLSVKKIKQQTRAAGSRTIGCKLPIEVNKLYLIAPENHVALTAKERPTFYIYLDRVPSQPIRYSLNSQKELLFQQTIEIARKGIIPITLPPGIYLEESREYFLTLGIVCEPRNPIKDFHVTVEFMKINLDRNLDSDLTSNVLWYDLLDLAYKSFDQKLFLSLINQIGFSKFQLD
ncbi:MAG: DUF928 domain-containing protein [Prochloraceae cyanobacterium]